MLIAPAAVLIAVAAALYAPFTYAADATVVLSLLLAVAVAAAANVPLTEAAV